MTKKKKKMAALPMTQFVHFVLCVMGPDGIEVQYPYGWISAEKLASIESAVDRMEYIVGFSEILEDQVIINGDTVVPRAEIEDANGRDDEFKKDMVDVFCKAAKEMKLKRLDRDTISRQLDKMIEEGKKVKSDNKQDN